MGRLDVDRQFLSIGSNTIEIEIFKNIFRSNNNYSFKPMGGLWGTIVNPYNTNDNDYVKYLNIHPEVKKRASKKGTIFSLKSDAKVVYLDSLEKLKALALEYPAFYYYYSHHDESLLDDKYLVDYEMLSRRYDAIYFSLNSFAYEMKVNNKLNASELSFIDFSSLLLFNPYAVRDYNLVGLDYNSYSTNIEIGEHKKVMDPEASYIMIKQYVTGYFLNNIRQYLTSGSLKSYADYLKKLSKYADVIATQIVSDNNDIVKYLIEQYGLNKAMRIINTTSRNLMSVQAQRDENLIKSLPEDKNKKLRYLY